MAVFAAFGFAAAKHKRKSGEPWEFREAGNRDAASS